MNLIAQSASAVRGRSSWGSYTTGKKRLESTLTAMPLVLVTRLGRGGHDGAVGERNAVSGKDTSMTSQCRRGDREGQTILMSVFLDEAKLAP